MIKRRKSQTNSGLFKIGFFVCVSMVSSLALAAPIQLGQAQLEAVQDVSAKLLADIYKRANVDVKITPAPAARLTYQILHDEIDGEVARIGPYFEKNPTLVKVEPTYYYLVTTAFAKKDRKISITSAEDLKKYKVGIIEGVYHAAIATEGVPNLSKVIKVEQLFEMLNIGRLDVVVDVGINGKFLTKKMKYNDIVSVGEIAKRDFYNALIPAKKDIAPKISKAITEMKSSGELEKLRIKYEKEVLDSAEAPLSLN